MANGALKDGKEDELAEETDEVVEEGGVDTSLVCLVETETELALPADSALSSGKEVIMTRKMIDAQALLRMS